MKAEFTTHGIVLTFESDLEKAYASKVMGLVVSGDTAIINPEVKVPDCRKIYTSESILEYLQDHPGSTARDIAKGISVSSYLIWGSLGNQEKRGVVVSSGKPKKFSLAKQKEQAC